MRTLYSLLIYLLTPLVLLYLALRGLRSRDYLQRWNERFAFFEPPGKTGGIVVHAVSMGEVNAAALLIRQLQKRYPELPICVTTFTPTGSEQVRTLFDSSVFHVFSPLDLPGAVRRFFDRLRPRLLIVLETEIWPNLYIEAAKRGVRVLIANARISDGSFGNYRRFGKLTALALQQVDHLAAQSEQDARRLIDLGVCEEHVSLSGNLKFDMRLPASLFERGEAIRLAWGTDRIVLVAGSTHEVDETILLEVFEAVREAFESALLVLVPRHPERFGQAAQLARGKGFKVSLRSEGIACPRNTQCFIVDSMGELLQFYAAGDVAFVGGSFERIGGHNLLEPAALAKPVLTGPHTFNSPDITRQLLDGGAALQLQDADELKAALLRLFADADARDRMGRAGLEMMRNGQGAVDRTLGVVEELLTREAG